MEERHEQIVVPMPKIQEEVPIAMLTRGRHQRKKHIHETVNLVNLKKWELEALIKKASAEKKRRYKNHQPPKYGDLNRTFTDATELLVFLNHVQNERVRLVFLLQAFLGLRISEACKIRISDLDLEQRRVWVRSAKGSTPSSMFLVNEVHQPLVDYCKAKKKELEQQDYLFPSHAEQYNTKSRFPHISPNFCRKYFSKTRKLLGLNMTYGQSDEAEGRKAHKLHKLTTHSFRRWFIQNVHAKTGDLMLTQKLARHRMIEHTVVYLHANQEKLDCTVKEALEGLQPTKRWFAPPNPEEQQFIMQLKVPVSPHR